MLPIRRILFVLFSVSIIAVIAVPAIASLVPGTYTLLTDNNNDGQKDLNNGNWIENFYGGSPGATNNILQAFGGSFQWYLNASLTGITPYSGSEWQYQTTYNINFQFVAPGAWGGILSGSNITATNLSRTNNGDLEFQFSFSYITSEGVPINFLATYDSGLDMGYTTFTTPLPGHQSGTNAFQTLSLQVVPIPGAVWLLGTGVIGLVAMRRRKMNN